jgi:DNA-binding FrmR family transcriptional regulator
MSGTVIAARQSLAARRGSDRYPLAPPSRCRAELPRRCDLVISFVPLRRLIARAGSLVYGRSMHGYTQDKDAYLRRLRRIEGQVRGLQRMVEDDTYCIDVLTQISAATRALQAVAVGLLEDHLGHCVAQAIEQGGPEADAKVKEAADAVSRLVRS